LREREERRAKDDVVETEPDDFMLPGQIVETRKIEGAYGTVPVRQNASVVEEAGPGMEYFDEIT